MRWSGVDFRYDKLPCRYRMRSYEAKVSLGCLADSLPNIRDQRATRNKRQRNFNKVHGAAGGLSDSFEIGSDSLATQGLRQSAFDGPPLAG